MTRKEKEIKFTDDEKRSKFYMDLFQTLENNKIKFHTETLSYDMVKVKVKYMDIEHYHTYSDTYICQIMEENINIGIDSAENIIKLIKAKDNLKINKLKELEKAIANPYINTIISKSKLFISTNKSNIIVEYDSTQYIVLMNNSKIEYEYTELDELVKVLKMILN